MICPLCRGVIDSKTNENRSIMYPDVEIRMKKIKFAIKLTIFVSLLVELLLLGINYATLKKISWSLISGAGLAYLCFTVYFSFQRKSGHRSKIAAQTILGMALLVLIDMVVGYSGWSVNIAIPIVLIAVDALMLIMMIANRGYWQNYIMMLILLFSLSVIGIILAIAGVVTEPVLMIVAAGITGMSLLGTVMFGSKKVARELSVRFKV